MTVGAGRGENGESGGRRLLKVGAAAALLAAVLGYGAIKMIDARTELLAARDRFVRVQAEAASVPREQRELERAKRLWEEKKKLLWRSAETGVMLKDLEDAARSGGVRLLKVEPGEAVEKFYRGHLRAVPVKVSFEGTFPGVLAAVSALERLASPGEVRQFQVKAAEQAEVPGTVRLDAEAVFYSLNPPEARGRVPGKSGRYDPFFPLVLPSAAPAAPAEDAGPAESGGKAAAPETPAEKSPGAQGPAGSGPAASEGAGE